MPQETILPDARLSEIQTHLHLHKARPSWRGLRCGYCREPWVDGACPTKRDATVSLMAHHHRAVSTVALPVGECL
ncbi:hypothetical protein [Natronoglycomyces albus]|uniref:Uncharacterized protein n=1 Tax=Natronoglycomyces albus TaxID=2811108 RepID=A0A895XQK4_9ACTN|nr:hypothetical protein [Natronoglycomyces albus]QSB05992.1 hypothetical protein JQS30_03450 [Natronoglycomyces albus]